MVIIILLLIVVYQIIIIWLLDKLFKTKKKLDRFDYIFATRANSSLANQKQLSDNISYLSRVIANKQFYVEQKEPLSKKVRGDKIHSKLSMIEEHLFNISESLKKEPL